MIPETGLAALWLAATLALLQFVLGAQGVRASDAEALRTLRAVTVVQGLFVAVAMGLLIQCFLTSDMSVALVAANSHSAKPWLYKFSGTWGNHEGSMLLWVTISAWQARRWRCSNDRSATGCSPRRWRHRRRSVSVFYAFLLFASNPFARLTPAPVDGQGLNPLLQGPRLGIPPADFVHRLCRHVGGVQLCGRRAGDARGQPRLREGDAHLGAGSMDIPDPGYNRGVVLGLL